MGFRQTALLRAAGRLGPCGSSAGSDLGSARTTGTRRIGVGRRATGLDQAHRSGLWFDWSCRRSYGWGDGGRRSGTAGLFAGGQVPPGSLSGFVFAAGIVPAGLGIHRADVSPAGRGITEEQLEKAQIGIARAAARRFELSTDVLAFDTTNFDTHIATTTPGELARRGHVKSKRSDGCATYKL